MVVDTATLVGVTEIAQRLNVRPNVVGNWVTRKRDFPTPVATLSCGKVWSWPDIHKWRYGATDRSIDVV